MKNYTIEKWGGLLSNEPDVQECDTTGDAMKNFSWLNKYITDD
jgi:hypothetical protein